MIRADHGGIRRFYLIGNIDASIEKLLCGCCIRIRAWG